MIEEIPYFSISEKDLQDNDFIEPFYDCDVCKDRHVVEFYESDRKDPRFRLGTYKCKQDYYVYSIGDKQILASKE